MSRFHPVRPKKQRAERAPEAAPLSPKEAEARLIQAVNEAARELYLQRDGASIDALIARCEKTLALYDRELEKVIESNAESHRWMVSPTVALRYGRELERLLKQREELQVECHAMARQIVQSWADENAPQQQAKTETNTDSGDKTAAAHAAPKGGEAADARSTAA